MPPPRFARLVRLALVPVGVTVAFAASLALAGPARAQMDSREGIALQNQILELRRDLEAVQSQRGVLAPPVRRGGDSGGGGGGGEIAAQLLGRVAQLEEDVRRLRGQLDEQSNASRRQIDGLNKQIADLNFRQQDSAATDPPGTAAPPPPAAPAPSGRRPPELAMQEGNAAYP